jgi:NitT/TauT family transport system substrate-binding protein
MKLRFVISVMSMFACFFIMSFMHFSEAQAEDVLTNFRYASWGPKNIDHADFFVAEDLGYFRDEGLKVEYIAAQGNGDALRNLIVGNADIAETDPSAIGFALDRGLKVKAIYNLTPQNQFTIIARKSRGIQKIEDLAGKKIAVVSMASGSRYNVMTLLNANKMKESDVSLIATGINFAGPLEQGQVDAAGTWEVINWDLTHRALPKAVVDDLIIFNARDVLNVPTGVLAATDESLVTNRAVLLKFLRAQRRGTTFMHDHPEQAAEIAAKYVTNAKDTPERNLAIVKLKISQQNNSVSAGQGYGWFTPGILDDFGKKYQEWGLMKNVYSFNDLATNELVKELK